MPAAVNWSSLSTDLVNCIGDVFLAAGDIDYYMRLRSVCRSWRSATDDPRGLSRRFRPHRWIMLDDLSHHADSRLFLNVVTGRFLWMHLPPLNNAYTYIGAADGLLVLGVLSSNGYDKCVVNPFTGSMVRFPSGQRSHQLSRVAIDGSMASPQLFFFDYYSTFCYGLSDPFPRRSRAETSNNILLATAVSFQGRVYNADNLYGSVMVVDRSDGHNMLERTTIINGNMDSAQSFLADSAGELLLVRVIHVTIGHVHVFRVDLEVKSLERIRSIGHHAIFLGHRCSMSVNADLLHAIQGNCIYLHGGGINALSMYQYHLEDGSLEVLTVSRTRRPFTLPQVIAKYCGGF